MLNGRAMRRSRAMTLHERIAQALGWSLEEAQSFSFQQLRELVRTVSPKLAHEISEAIRTGHYITRQDP